jgi:hypothetical protein
MARARNTDPVTSHLAAESVGDVTRTQEYILKALRKARTDVELVEAYTNLRTAPRASESGIRSRRAELVRKGLVIDTGKRVRLDSGRYAIVWGRSNG